MLFSVSTKFAIVFRKCACGNVAAPHLSHNCGMARFPSLRTFALFTQISVRLAIFGARALRRRIPR